MSEPVANLKVSVSADVSPAERGLARFSAGLRAAAASAGQQARAVDQATAKVNISASSIMRYAAALDSADRQQQRATASVTAYTAKVDQTKTALAAATVGTKEHERLTAQLASAEQGLTRAMDQQTAAAQRGAIAAQQFSEKQGAAAAAIQRSTEQQAATATRSAERQAAAAATVQRETDRVARAEFAAGLAATDNAGRVDMLRHRLAGLQQGTAAYHQAAKQLTVAERALTTETARLAEADRQAAAEAQRLAASQNVGIQFATSLKQGLIGIVGPAAAATAVIATIRTVVQSFFEAFKYKTEIDETRKSIEIQLKGLRDSNLVFSQAQRFAERYKLTQKETTEAISASIPVIRESKSSIEDILGVFARLQMRQPGKTFEDAARAIGELQAGQVQSIEHIFNVPAAKANEMKAAIAGGADAIAVLNKFLAESGLGMDALEARTQGAAGAMRDAEKAQEALTLAQARFANGPGIVFLQAEASLLNKATVGMAGLTVLTNIQTAAIGKSWAAIVSHNLALVEFLGLVEHIDTKSTLGGRQSGEGRLGGKVNGGQLGGKEISDIEALRSATLLAQNAVDRFTGSLGEQSAAAGVAKAQSALLAQRQQELYSAAQHAARGSEDLGVAAQRLAKQFDAPIYQVAELLKLLRQVPGANAAASIDPKRDGGPKTKPGEAPTDVAKAHLEYLKATGSTYQKLILAQKELKNVAAASGTKSVEYWQKLTEVTSLQQQLASEREAAAKRGIKDATSRLNLEERTADAVERQLKAAVDARLAALDDRVDRRKEQKDLERARRVLASPGASAAQRQAAMDVLERIPLEQEKRRLDIAGKRSEAGASVINGKLYEVRPGGGGGSPATASSGGGTPFLPFAATSASSGGVPTTPNYAPPTVNVSVAVYLDSEQIAARVEVRQQAAYQAARAAGIRRP